MDGEAPTSCGNQFRRQVHNIKKKPARCLTVSCQKRVENRSYQKYGNRMLPGGHLYEQEKRFLEFVKSREEDAAAEWMQSLTCPILRVDGTKPVEENTNLIIAQIQNCRPF